MSFLEGLRRGASTRAPQRRPMSEVDDTQGPVESNLITLLNFAQEVGAGTTNTKLKDSADRLRQQFVKSFTSRYELSTGGGAIAEVGSMVDLLSNINSDATLCAEAKAVRDVVLLQMGECGGEEAINDPKTILFYNERLRNLNEYRHTLPFPLETLQPVTLADEVAAVGADQRTENTVTGSDIMAAIKEKKLREEREIAMAQTKEEEQNRLKQEAAPRTRKRDRLMQGLRSIFKRNSGEDGDSGSADGTEEELETDRIQKQVDNYLASETQDSARIETNAAGQPGQSRQELVAAASIKQTLRRAKRQRLQGNPTLIEQQRQDVAALKEAVQAEVDRWRLDASRIVSDAMGLGGLQPTNSDLERYTSGSGGNKRRSYAISKPLAAKLQSTEARPASLGTSWKQSVSDIETARFIFPEPRQLKYEILQKSAFTVQRDVPTSVRTELASDAYPNYAALIHACLLASLATYNLALMSVFEGVESYVESTMNQMKEHIQSYQRQLLDEDFGYLSSLSRETASALQTILDLDMTNDEDVQRQKEDELGLRRARVLSRMALGRLTAEEMKETIAAPALSSVGVDGPDEAVTDLIQGNIEVETIRSDKACCIVTTDFEQGVTVVAFRGTLDPIDVLTDISFVSSPFAEVNDRIRTTFAASDALVPEYDVVEVHGGFLQAFTSIADQLTVHLDTVANAAAVATVSSQSKHRGEPSKHTLLFTGHSMGGALAQLASAYYVEREFSHPVCTNLVSFAAPAVGNADFVKYINNHVGPYGGIRVWNEYDSVPYLATVVGYELGGIPIKMPLRKGAVALFKKECRHSFASSGGFDAVMPHVLYQVGPVVYTFPIFGQALNEESSSDGEG